MDRLSTLDAAFLRVETPTAHMHVGWLSSLKLPAGEQSLDRARLTAQIENRLHLAPRFRKVPVQDPLRIADPVWRDTPRFRIGDHLMWFPDREVSERELRVICDTFLSRQLQRDRPLWEILVVPRLEGGRAAVLGKVHHAMVDGIAAVELGVLMFDPSPDVAPSEPAPRWVPAPIESRLQRARDAAADTALEQFRALGAMARLGLQPRRAMRHTETLRRAAFSLAEDAIWPAPPSYLNVRIGPRRCLVTSRVEISRLLALKRRYAVTLNDVVLAVVTGALRRLATECSEEPGTLRAMVPVSVRDPGDGAGGNRITFGFVDLPVAELRADRQLAGVKREMDRLKSSGEIAGSEVLMRSLGVLPGPIKSGISRLSASPRMYNLTVSNVPGPRVPLYAAGAEVLDIYPVIPIADGHSIAIGVLTYTDGLHFAAYTDPEALPEAAALPEMFERALLDLERLGGARSRRRSSHRGPEESYVRAARAKLA